MMDYNTRKCVVCGKEFIPASEHIFKRGRIWLCGWNCTCEFEKGDKKDVRIGIKRKIRNRRDIQK